jgi:hypothetical protein
MVPDLQVIQTLHVTQEPLAAAQEPQVIPIQQEPQEPLAIPKPQESALKAIHTTQGVESEPQLNPAPLFPFPPSPEVIG